MAKETGEVVTLPQAPALDKAQPAKPSEVSARATGILAMLEAIAVDTGEACKAAHGKLDELERLSLEGIQHARATIQAVRDAHNTIAQHANLFALAIEDERAKQAKLIKAGD